MRIFAVNINDIVGIVFFLPVEHIGNVDALFRHFAGDLSDHGGDIFVDDDDAHLTVERQPAIGKIDAIGEIAAFEKVFELTGSLDYDLVAEA